MPTTEELADRLNVCAAEIAVLKAKPEFPPNADMLAWWMKSRETGCAEPPPSQEESVLLFSCTAAFAQES